MEPAEDIFSEYRKSLSEGKIQLAYRAILKFVLDLRSGLSSRLPDFEVSGLYQGYMDMTYFAVTPKPLLARGLKLAIVFLHEKFVFEIWLVGRTRQFQKKYIGIFSHTDCNIGKISAAGPGIDSIIEKTLVAEPNFSNTALLKDQIETGIINFAQQVETLLAGLDE